LYNPENPYLTPLGTVRFLGPSPVFELDQREDTKTSLLANCAISHAKSVRETKGTQSAIPIQLRRSDATRLGPPSAWPRGAKGWANTPYQFYGTFVPFGIFFILILKKQKKKITK